MKKLFFTLISIAIVSSNVIAKPTGLNLGGGVGLNSLPEIDVNEVKTTVGPYLEVGYDIPLNKSCYIYAGLRYGEKFGSGDFELTKESMRIGEITVPVKFQYVINRMSRNKFFFEVGPSLNILTSMKGTLYNKSSGESGTYDYIASGDYNMIGAFIGGNFGVKFSDHFKLSVGGDYCLTKINNADDAVKRWQCNLGFAYIF